jgi:hypothetical protein
MSRRLPGPDSNSIPACLHANSTAFAQHGNAPSSSISGSFASRMPTRPPRNTPYANGSNSFYPNSLSSWLYLGFLPTTTSQNAVSALRLSLARSAVARAVPKAQRLAWAWLSVRNLDGATSQSFPPVPCPADLSIFFGSTLNRIQQDSSLRCGCQYAILWRSGLVNYCCPPFRERSKARAS